MEFSSIAFIFAFLPLTMLVYFCTSKKRRNLVLFIANLVFYAWAEPLFVFLLLAAAVVDYGAGLLLERYRPVRWKRRSVLWAVVALHLFALLAFKYQVLLPWTDPNAALLTDVLVPLGISIYLFQGLSYVIDLYLQKIKVQKNFIDFGVYLAFFPTMVCGPILRYSDLRTELGKREETLNKAATGYSLFIKGLSKKMLLADSLLNIWYSIQELEHGQMSVLTAWLGIAAFALAIYFYFGGYSDMARGIAKILGFDIPANFNYPYVSRNINEFSRRWNISLINWFKAYVFTPLAPNSSAPLITVLKLLLTWTLVGAWYGNGVGFALWGLYLGVFILAERLFLVDLLNKIPVVFQRIYTLAVILLGWVLFEMDTLPQALSYYGSLFSGPFIDKNSVALYYLGHYWLLLVLAIFCATNVWHNFTLKLELQRPVLVRWGRIVSETALTVICVVYAIGGQPNALDFFVRF